MKKLITSIIIIISISINAQRKSETNSFDMSKTFKEVKKEYKANFFVKDSLILKDGSSIKVGQLLKFGKSANENSDTYQRIYGGKLPTIAGALAGVKPYLLSNAQARGVEYLVSRIKIQRSMGVVTMLIELQHPDFDGGIFGKSHVYTVGDVFSIGELINPNAPLSRGKAIAKLKESKELFDLGLMSESEYLEITNELSKIILKK